MLQAPFYFIAQYEAAQRLIAVPYATLHALAGEVELDPQHIILFYSTGRCGSTLVSHVLNQTPTVVSFSEPDVFTQLVKLRTAGQSNDAEVTALLYDFADDHVLQMHSSTGSSTGPLNSEAMCCRSAICCIRRCRRQSSSFCIGMR